MTLPLATNLEADPPAILLGVASYHREDSGSFWNPM